MRSVCASTSPVFSSAVRCCFDAVLVTSDLTTRYAISVSFGRWITAQFPEIHPWGFFPA